MLTLAILKRLIPEIGVYLKQGYQLVLEKDEDGKSVLDIENYYDSKKGCNYYSVQLELSDKTGRDSYFIYSRIYFNDKTGDVRSSNYCDSLQTTVEYEIEHEENVKDVHVLIQTVDFEKCLVERTVRKTNCAGVQKTAHIAERLVDECRDFDGVLTERKMYSGEILIPYNSLKLSGKWREYINNPGNLTKVRNLRFIPVKRPGRLTTSPNESE